MAAQIWVQFQFLFSVLVTLFLWLGLGGLFGQSNPFFSGAFGILLSGSLALLWNFFAPLDSLFFGFLVLVAGIGFYKNRQSFKIQDLALIIGVTILYWLLGIRTPPMSDTGLYHIPVIHWMHVSALPFGTANLHDRLGTWNFWFSVCGAASAGNVLPFAVYGLNICLFSLVVSDYVKCLLKAENRSLYLGYAISILALYFTFDLWSEIRGQKSPDADFAGSLLCAWCIFYFIQRFEMASILLAGIAILVKLNQAPLALIPLYFVCISIRDKRFKANLLVLVSIKVAGLLMVLKSFWTTGCLLYPSAFTCTSVRWAIPLSTLRGALAWVKSWARQPGVSPDIVLKSWDWFPTWWTGFIHFKIVFLLGVAMLISITLAILKKIKLDPLVIGVLVALVIFWFFSAPDIRFIYGGLIALCGALVGPAVQTYFPLKWTKPVLWIITGFAVVGAIGQVHRAEDYGAATLLRQPVVYATRNTLEKQPILVPEKNECWDLPPLCTPYFNEKLIVTETFGRLTLITGLK